MKRAGERPGTAGGADDPRLVAALEECLADLEGGLRPDRAALRERYPELADELLACLDGLEFVHRAAPTQVGPTDLLFLAPEQSGRLGDYRIVREVGRGGMGVVYEAVETTLGRRVALKVLPLAAALDPVQLRRFRNEARVAALLQHPHIVPVYATGCERGVHYYAMQYVDGPSLAGLIRGRQQAARVPGTPGPAGETGRTNALSTARPNSAAQTPTGGPGGADTFREAARIGAEAAEALEAAHQAGVIHRDVKPANLLLDASGAVWVADFGLARFRDEASLTRTGNVLGTLRYMSPEQALGHPGLVDHRTDVYSLGATLYELLTLRTAYTATDRQQLLRQIGREEPPRPRDVRPAVPPPLEAVVRKAMAKHPADRYGSAAELAADLRRFLGGKAVHARPPGVVARCRRWAARHSGAVLAATAAAGVLLAVLSAGVVVVVRERNAAEAGKRQARSAVDEMYTEVAERWLSRQSCLEPKQLEFLEKARRYYDEFARDAGPDPAARLEAVRARRRVADIQRRLGRLAAAETAYTDAEKSLEPLVHANSGADPAAEELALVHTGRGALRRAAGNLAGAEQEFRSAVALYEQLASGGEPRYALGRAGCEVDLGATLAALGRREEAGQAYGRARASLELLTRTYPANREALHDLAGCLTDEANLLAPTRQPEAEELFRRAVTAEDQLLAAAPGRVEYRHARATTSAGLAALLAGVGRFAEARTEAVRALELCGRLAADFPHTPVYREQVAAGSVTLGDVLAASGRPGEARAWYNAAATEYATLAGAFPEAPEYRRGSAEALTRSADLLANAGRLAAAQECYRAGLSRLSRDPGDGRPARQDAARAWAGLAGALSSAGRRGEARAALAAALVGWDALAAEHLADDTDRWGLAAVLVDHGAFARDAGRYGEADAAFRRAVAMDDQLASDRPAVPGYRLALAVALANLGALLSRTGRVAEAVAAYRRALDAAGTLAAGHPTVPDNRRVLALCLAGASRLSVAAG